MFPDGFQLGPLFIRFYGIILMTGALAGGWLAARELKRRGSDPEIVWDLLIWLIIGGVIGARLWHVFGLVDTRQATFTVPGVDTTALGKTIFYAILAALGLIVAIDMAAGTDGTWSWIVRWWPGQSRRPSSKLVQCRKPARPLPPKPGERPEGSTSSRVLSRWPPHLRLSSV